MQCSLCGGNNFTWASRCDHCGASLGPERAAITRHASSLSSREATFVDPEIVREREFKITLAVATPYVFVTPVLIAVNALVFIAMAARGVSPTSPALDELIRWGADYGPLTTNGQSWRLLSSAFIHIGMFHLLMNMYVLLGIGTFTERLFGNVGFLTLYLLTAVGGSLTSTAWHPMSVSAGASGAIFGLYGGLIGFLIVRHRSVPRESAKSLAANAAAFVLFNVAYGFTKAHVDVAAHVGGFAAGIPIGCALALPLLPGIASRRLWLSALVAATGAFVAVATASRLPVVDDWRATFARFVELEQASGKTYNEAIGKLRAEQMSPAAFAEMLDHQLAPRWTDERAGLAALRIPAEQKKIARKVDDFIRLKLEAWRLTADGVRAHDSAMVREGNLKQEAALEALQALAPNKAVADALSALRLTRAESDAFSAEIGRLQRTENDCVKSFNGWLTKLRSRQMTPEQVADLVDQRLLMTWESERLRLAKTRVPEGRQSEAATLVEYMSLRADGWRLAARGLRANDIALGRQGT